MAVPRSGVLCAMVVAFSAGGCGARDRPYRFSSPLLGAADVPPTWSGQRERSKSRAIDPAPAAARRTPTEDPRPGTIRVASALAAANVIANVEANGVVWSRLAAPNRDAPDAPHAALHEPSDLRALVGRRDSRDPATVALAWSAELGAVIAIVLEVPASPARESARTRGAAVLAATLANTGTLVAWAATHARLAAPTDTINAGDLVVFARTESDDAPDLVGLAIARDARGVTEFIYCAGGAIRRGLVDPQHPALHRDPAGAVVNTFVRTGNRWPPPGTHYLAGELLVHVIRAR